MYFPLNESTTTSGTPAIFSCRNLMTWRAANIVKKPQTLGRDCRSSDVIGLYCCLRKLFFLTTERMCKKHYLTRVCRYYPMLILHIAGLRIYYGRSVNIQSWNIVRWERSRYWYSSSGIRLINCWRETFSISYVFQQHQLCQLQPKTFLLPIKWVQ